MKKLQIMDKAINCKHRMKIGLSKINKIGSLLKRMKTKIGIQGLKLKSIQILMMISQITPIQTSKKGIIVAHQTKTIHQVRTPASPPEIQQVLLTANNDKVEILPMITHSRQKVIPLVPYRTPDLMKQLIRARLLPNFLNRTEIIEQSELYMT